MWFCLACFLPSGWSGIPAHRCCWREQMTETCGCGRSRPESAKPSRALRARLPPARSCLMVSGGEGGTQTLKHSHIKISKTKHSSSGKRAVVGYEDGTVRVWDLKQGNTIHVIKGRSGIILMLTQPTKVCLCSFYESQLLLKMDSLLLCVRSGWPPRCAYLPGV